ncbi:uncharacterized protein N7506_008101 [Penicillium brevicompactum]|uniref:uncharacterized protein n=1 Tax=Penicillium brevicompactum TaxID=5074 RepID=UPI0025423CD6|nr:uncharacterized protein N7506_008101 [Penicillium brevicompactum]KAJ5334318.1 hypothetical protein N7506_008101 [Penicillium brevicompactum]
MSHDHADSELKMEPPSNGNGNAMIKNSDSRPSSRISSRTSQSPLPKKELSPSPDTATAAMKNDPDIKQERPKLSRSSSKVSRPPPLYDHLPDSTKDALATFEQIAACQYANKYMGYTELAMECDCAEEWDSSLGQNLACGEDSDCINRATKIECAGDCGCGADCRNQRFQKGQFASVAVIKTEKKGFGLRAETNLHEGDLIYEYVGEVVAEQQFRKRMRQYDEEGIKHFYFMSLSTGEFVDATKRGNLGRFCNHSCNPNCFVDKWVVGEKMRMGIFAERAIQAGEELVFNYNVDRYGADPQPCYCGEPMCTGFIGGRTQTERATKLSNSTMEALGMDDEEDGWDTVVAKRPKKKKTGEDDDEYVENAQPKSLSEDSVTKVMAALVQCQEKWIAVKLLGRIQRCEDERVRSRVVKMHGYQILNAQLTQWKEDYNVVLQILNILDSFPRLTRNKIIDSKIEANIQPLTTCGDERVAEKAAKLLASWAGLKIGYRIPRTKRGQDAKQAVNQFERRETGVQQRQRSVTRSPSPVYDAPRGPAQQRRDRGPQRGPRQQNRRGNWPLPDGWFTAESDGRTYYYSASGKTTWERPTAPATPATAPGQPSKNQQNLALQKVIDGIMNAREDTPSEKKTDSPATPQPADLPEKKSKETEKWRKLPLEKQKKIYENTLFPHIKGVVDQYKHKIPKDKLKRFAKDTAKKLVESDYKKNRVTDPTKISSKHQQTVKSYCKTFFDKAATKYEAIEKLKSMKSQDATPTPTADVDDAVDIQLLDDDTALPSPEDDEVSLKRKHEETLHVDRADEVGDGDISMANASQSPKDTDMNMETPNQNPQTSIE